MRQGRGAGVAALFAALLAFYRPTIAHASDPITEIEKIVGKQLAAGIRSDEGVDEDPLLLPWLRDIGAKVSAPSPRHNVNYEFQIAGTDIANAFALPGGYIFVTRGMLDEVSSDDELATIMAHECGHVAERHAQKQIGENVAFLALMSVLHEKKYDNLRTGATVLNVLATLAISRSDEAQADVDGIKFASAAGYDPRGLVQFFEGIGNDHPGALERYFDTHPTPAARIAHALDNPLVTKPSPEIREASAHGYEVRDLPVAAARVRAGRNALVLPPVPPLPPLPDYLSADRADAERREEAIRKGLRSSETSNVVGNILQQVLLINNQPNDVRWLVLAAETYAIQERVDNLFSRTLRVIHVATPTFDALTAATLAKPGDGPLAAEAALGRSEIRVALEKDAGAPIPIRHAATAVATVLADLNNRFYQPRGTASYLRYGADAGLLVYASTELDRADKASGIAWRQMSLARIRRYQARLNALVPEDDANRRRLWLDLAERRFGGVFPDKGPTGDSSVRGALSIEKGVSATGLDAERGTKTWADWVLEQKGTPENVATVLRLLTLDLERETAAGDGTSEQKISANQAGALGDRSDRGSDVALQRDAARGCRAG